MKVFTIYMEKTEELDDEEYFLNPAVIKLIIEEDIVNSLQPSSLSSEKSVEAQAKDAYCKEARHMM